MAQTHSFSPSIGYSSACIWKHFYSGVSKHIKSNIIILSPSSALSRNFPFAPFSGKLILLMGYECYEFFYFACGVSSLTQNFSPRVLYRVVRLGCLTCKMLAFALPSVPASFSLLILPFFLCSNRFLTSCYLICWNQPA